MPTRTNQPEPRTRRATATRRPVERVLSAPLIEQLKADVRQAGNVSAPLARELDERYGIERDHGITPRRLRNFLTRLAVREDGKAKAADGADAGASCEPVALESGKQIVDDAADGDAAESFARRLRNHRVRQASVASILDKTFGQFADCTPDVWGYRAYLMLVGVVYERLAINEEDVSTEELVALAKVLAENRRLEVRLREMDKPNRDNGQATHPKGPLPDHFGDIVRRVYGTNFQRADRRGARKPKTGTQPVKN